MRIPREKRLNFSHAVPKAAAGTSSAISLSLATAVMQLFFGYRQVLLTDCYSGLALYRRVYRKAAPGGIRYDPRMCQESALDIGGS